MQTFDSRTLKTNWSANLKPWMNKQKCENLKQLSDDLNKMTLSFRYKYQSSLEQTACRGAFSYIERKRNCDNCTAGKLRANESKYKEIDAADPEINKLNEEITKSRAIASCEVQITNASELIKGDKQYLELKKAWLKIIKMLKQLEHNTPRFKRV